MGSGSHRVKDTWYEDQVRLGSCGMWVMWGQRHVRSGLCGVWIISGQGYVV